MAERRINLPEGTPRKGWDYVGCADYGKPIFTCEACGNPEVRYVHELEHDEMIEPLHVGCVCAEHLTRDYVNPRKQERRAKSFSARFSRFMVRPWRVSAKGTRWMQYRGHLLWIFQRQDKSWGYAIDQKFSSQRFTSDIPACRAMFKQLDKQV